jgi:predicted dehydrogenase
MGVNLDYPAGRPDTLEYILRGDPDWTTAPIDGNWFPDAFIGSMGSLQSFVQGETATLPTSVEDAIDTMRVVEAAYLSSQQGGVPLPPIS